MDAHAFLLVTLFLYACVYSEVKCDSTCRNVMECTMYNIQQVGRKVDGMQSNMAAIVNQMSQIQEIASQKEEIQNLTLKLESQLRGMKLQMATDIEEIQQSMATDREEIQQAMATDREEIQQAMATDREEIQQAMATDREEIQQAMATDREEIQQAMATDIEEIQQAMATDREEIQQAMATDREEIQQAMATDIEEIQQTMATDIEEIQQTMATDREEIQQAMATDIEDMQRDIASQTDELVCLKEEVASQKSEIKSQKQEIHNLTLKFESQLSEKTSDQEKEELSSYVSFTAYATQIRGFTRGDHVMFDATLRNYGSAYYVNASEFICPVNAYYMISISIMTDKGEWMYSRIMLDGEHLVMAYAHGDHKPSSSQTMVTYCEAGQRIWVKCVSKNNVMYGHRTWSYSTFGVTLLRVA